MPNIQVISSFIPAPNGFEPNVVIQGTDGNFYGCASGGAYQLGTIFKITSRGVLTTLHTFTGTTDGAIPTALVEGLDGNFYGYSNGDGVHPGTVFKITAKGVFTVLANTGQNNMAGGLVRGTDGNFYGMDETMPFRLTPGGVITHFSVVTGMALGRVQNPLITASDGNIYGSSQQVIFKIQPDGTPVTLVNATNSDFYWNMRQGPDGNFYGLVDHRPGWQIFKMTPGGTISMVPTSGLDPGQLLALTPAANGSFYGIGSLGNPDSETVFKMTAAGVITKAGTYPTSEHVGGGTAYMSQGPKGTILGFRMVGGPYGAGLIFTLTPAGAYKTLYTFQADGGEDPLGNLAMDAKGNLYGTTLDGGAYDCGSVYQLSTRGVMKTLTSFDGDIEVVPYGVTFGKDGKLYGTIEEGPGGNFDDGAVFQVTTAGQMKFLYKFPTNAFGPSPLMLGKDGNLYGTLQEGADIFRINAAGQYSVVAGINDIVGYGPAGALALVQGPDGTIYGLSQSNSIYNGNLFKYSQANGLSNVVSFPSDNYTFNELLMGRDGNLYGINYWDESIYRVTPSGKLSTYTSFASAGSASPAGLIQDSAGNFYGVTSEGGASNCGTVFVADTKGTVTVLGNFDVGTQPSKLVLGKDGYLYGANYPGGTAGAGYIFKVKAPLAPAPPPTRRAAEQVLDSTDPADQQDIAEPLRQ